MPGPNRILNSILRNMTKSFHKLLFLFFSHYYKQQQILALWNITLTTLLCKKGDPAQLINHRPIALANTICKLFTTTLTLILLSNGEQHQNFHESQEGFRAERSTTRQLQLLIAALENTRLTNQNIYIFYRLQERIRISQSCQITSHHDRSWIPRRRHQIKW